MTNKSEKYRNLANNYNILQFFPNHGNNLSCFALLSIDQKKKQITGVRDHERNYN